MTKIFIYLFQVEFHGVNVEDFQAPSRLVDLIIVGHVMYYIKEDFHTVIERFTRWLNPGGAILMSHSAPHDLFLKMGKCKKTCSPTSQINLSFIVIISLFSVQLF